MDTHDIHGTQVGFHSDAKEAREFLKHGVHSDTARGYLEQAERHGEAHFYDKEGTKFKIKHEKDEKGESIFSVEKSKNH